MQTVERCQLSSDNVYVLVDSIPVNSRPSSLTIANGHSPTAVQFHIYIAFLEREVADVTEYGLPSTASTE
ncbi:hypothetical protein NM688_g7320 [Phlebia brevispora]|uniref:Uncharacterized protein n=1 Tax=Phlebia brevispora TaxID=194682 RepID=A0ACC1S6T3_9APHY|nr:hypothetical protein NM688_g7320 [Phlebia brevispora]